MSEVVDLNERRNAASKPDPDFVRQDDFGRPMFLYLLNYEFENAHWHAEVWAYSEEEAQRRVAAMRESLKYMGQMFTVVPA